jgi:indole-3-acetate monooxygenase
VPPLSDRQRSIHVQAAHAFLHTALAAAWEQASATRSVPTREHMLLRLAATHGIHAAADVVGAVYHAAGSAAIFNSNPFERRLRDINAVTQQVQASPLFFETVGQFLLRGNSYS